MNELSQRLTRLLTLNLNDKFTALSYAIMIDGQIVAADALGHCGEPEKLPATTDCTFNVASVSKIYCTVAVMQLVERGLVDLDEPVVTYLPRFVMADERYRFITLRHCLSHSSGLPGTQWRGFSVSSTKGSCYSDDVYDYLSRSTLKADPGEYSVYCNDGFTLAELVVSAVTGKNYSQYCLEAITEPLGAASSRFSDQLNEAFPLVHEGKKPAELLLIQGGAGLTTTMTDLCAFGNLFLRENSILSCESMVEMARLQGKTYLNSDNKTPSFGLGWDSVNYQDPDYNLGDGVLQKGGNSFQFTTQFLVVPHYNAVIALSETHDCRLDVPAMTLRLFSEALAYGGTNISRRSVPIPEELAVQWSGQYLTPGLVLDLQVHGLSADVAIHDLRGHHTGLYNNLQWHGQFFKGGEEERFFFESQGDDQFLMTDLRGRAFPIATKVRSCGELPESWKERIGKSYLVADVDPEDLVIHENMAAFTIFAMPDCQGLCVFSFIEGDDSDVYRHFDSTLCPVDDQRGRGVLRAPAGGSRDLLDPCFIQAEDGERCFVASYQYRDVASLPTYEGQTFSEERRVNGLYVIQQELKEVPPCPEGRRIMAYDTKLQVVYDSLFQDTWKPLAEGFLALI